MKKSPHLKKFRYTPTADTPLSRSSISVKLPVEIDAWVRSLDNRSQWLIKAISEKYYEEVDK